jgi:hypothetical protein
MHAPTLKALTTIGMTADDMERMDFYKRSGRKAAAALRSMGYSRERFPTYAGNAVTRWAEPAPEGEFRRPVGLDDTPAFHVLVMAFAARG